MGTGSTCQISAYAGKPVTKVPDWQGLVAIDLLLNNMATGLFLTAALSQLAAPGIFTPVARIAYPIALILLLADLLALVLDLGDILRFHHMLRVFKPGAPMSVGTWCLTIFSGTLFLVAVTNLIPAGMIPPWVPRLMLILALLPAMGSVAYKGILFSTTSQPGWQDARWLGGYLTNSALVLGCAQMLVIGLVMPDVPAATRLIPALAVLLLLNLVPKGLLVANLRTTLSRLYTRRKIWSVGAVLFCGGVLLPLLVLIFSGNPLSILLATACIVIENLLFRFIFVKLPHRCPG
jgi:hypothetical protein